MLRNMFGSVLALIGALASVWSAFRPWYNGRTGTDIRLQDVFQGITTHGASELTSLLLPMCVAALLTVVGVLLRSRLLVALAGVLVLVFTILWMVRQAQASGDLTAGGPGLGSGAALATGGGLLLLLAALSMSGRSLRRSRHRRGGRRGHEGAPYPPEPYGDTHYSGPAHGASTERYGDDIPEVYGEPPRRPSPEEPGGDGIGGPGRPPTSGGPPWRDPGEGGGGREP